MTKRLSLQTCRLRGCQRIGIIKLRITSKLDDWGYEEVAYCCKTHMLRHLSTIKFPRYSKKKIQRLAGTAPLLKMKVKLPKIQYNENLGNPVVLTKK